MTANFAGYHWLDLFSVAEPGERFTVPRSELVADFGQPIVRRFENGDDDELLEAIQRRTERRIRWKSTAHAGDPARAEFRFEAGEHEILPARAPRKRARKNPLASLDTTPPADVLSALRRGLDLYDQGYGGPGLRSATVKWARALLNGQPITRQKAVQMRAWFARHDASKAEKAARWNDPTSPANVAYLLWGGAPGRRWARELLAKENPRAGFWRKLTQPMAGDDAATQYERLHWGIRPRARRALDVPGMTVRQDVVQLGRLRALVLESTDGQVSAVVKPRGHFPRLVVGAKDNRLYLCDHQGFALPPAWHGATILRVDYDASKGEDRGVYWYHDHEPDFPSLRLLAGGLPQYAGGSYVVAPEGITG